MSEGGVRERGGNVDEHALERSSEAEGGTSIQDSRWRVLGLEAFCAEGGQRCV